MKNSKKILAFLLSTFMICTVPAVVTACNKEEETPPPIEQPTDPVKVKDGGDVSVKTGETKNVTVSEYITANGNTVEVTSTNTEVATASLNEGIVGILGKAQGTTTVKLKCGVVEVTFNVTVTEASGEVKTPAPKFDNVTESLDLRLASFKEVALSPKENTGGEKFDIAYSVGSLVSGAEIVEGNKLKFTPTETGNYAITVSVACTEKTAATNVYNLTFTVTIAVTRSSQNYKVTVDGVETQVAEGTVFTIPAFTGTVPEGKEFDGWQVGSDKKNAGDTVTITGNVTITSTFKAKTYTVSIDGVSETKEHGSKITLPEYTKTIPDGKQFTGWTDGVNTFTVGSQITVTGNLTITAVIENIPDTPPELVKGTDTVSLVIDNDSTKNLNISDYITTNGNAVRVEHEGDAAEVSSTLTQITVTANKAGTTTVTIKCGSLTVTITVNVAYPPSQVVEDTVTDPATHDLFDGELILNLAQNITYNAQVKSYKVNGTAVEGSTYKVTGSFGETAREETYTVTAEFENASPLQYTYKVTVKDTTAYRIVNGGFDNWTEGKPDGWTVTDNYGGKQTASTYWAEERPFDNIGSYFGETDENKKGTLQSSTFKVGNSGWVTFQLGSAKPDKAIWVEVIDASDGKVLGKFKNTQFADPESAQRLIPYKLNLSAVKGSNVYIKITDDQDGSGFATFFADSFNTWHDVEPTTITADNDSVLTYVNLGSPVFENITGGVDLKNGNKAEVALPKAVWGMIETTYTYSTSTAGAKISDDGKKLEFTAAKSGVYTVNVTGTTPFGSSEFTATITVTNTKERPEVENKSLGQINIDTQNLTVTENLTEGNDNFAVSYQIKTAVSGASLSGNVFTYTATAGQSKGTVTVTLVATFTDKTYQQETFTEEITLSIEIVGNSPAIKESTVTKEFDLNGGTSAHVVLDLSENVTVPASVNVEYSVTGVEGGNVDGSTFTADLSAGTYALTVKVSYGAGEELTYTYNVKVAQYSVINGDFETGTLDGWTYTVADGSTDFGRIDNETYYWVGKGGSGKLNKQGTWLFTGVETDETKGKVNLESGKGTLTSSTFTLKQNGWISFLMGGAHNANCGVRIRTVEGDSILAEFNNEGRGTDAAMDRYIYKFTGMQADTDCYIEVFDDAEGGWGLVAVDDFITDWGDARPDHVDAKVIVPEVANGQVKNGRFATGDLSGWNILTDGMTGGVINASTYWGEKLPFNNSGYFLSGFDTGIAEGNTWAIRSSTLTLQGSGWMSVRMGGHAAAVKVFKADGTPIGEYRANHFSDTNFPFVNDDHSVGGSWADMRTYFIDLHDHIGEEIYIELHDIAVDGWANAFFDEVVTYYESAPDIDNGFDTVTSPVSVKSSHVDDEGKTIVDEYNYGEVQLKWRLAEKEN